MLCIALTALGGCFSMPAARVARGYTGAERPDSELSFVTFQGSGFPDIYLYRVDGRPRTEYNQAMVESTYTDEGPLGFNVSVLPGEHVLEFTNVHKTPFDTTPLRYLQIRFSTEAGKTYAMEHAGDSWQVTCAGAIVPSTVEPVPVLEVPAEGKPRAMLVFQQAADSIVPYVFRIDGRIAPQMHFAEPRWVCFNRVNNMASGLDPRHGELSLALAPGRHVIEYASDILVVRRRVIENAVRILEFDAVAGKTYRLVISGGPEGTWEDVGSPAVVKAE